MTWRVQFKPIARREVTEARDWYDEQAPGLGKRFSLALDKTIAAIQSHPLAFRPVYKGIRRFIVRGFPYAVSYLVEDELITVIAVTHSARHPDLWQRRA